MINPKRQIQGNGIPAINKQIVYNQPDGSKINLVLKGDAAIHWAVSEDGYTLISNPNGFYEYAKIENNGKLVISGITAHDINNRTNSELSFLKTVKKGIWFNENQISMKKENYKSKVKSSIKSFPSTGTHKFLVFMVQFSDLSFTKTATAFDNMMNQSNYGGTGSFKDYHFSNSNGLLTVNTTIDGIYTAPNTHDYYGQNDVSGSDMNVEELFNFVVNAADATVDFTQYDNDNDGVVDAIYFIYAGSGEASSGIPSDIWPHNNPGITPITVDGVTINSYTCSNEVDAGNMVGIGTICHEFGHAMSLPDFYDTDYAGSGGQAEGTGSWDIMSSGNYNGGGARPATHNPISKEMLGWQSTTEITTNNLFTLPASETNSIAYSVKSSSSNESFILENKQQIGFDLALPNHGMLIYHADIDYITAHLSSNDINVDPSHQGFDLEEADNETTSEVGDVFPGAAYTSFTDYTTPSSVLWIGNNLNYPITGITESGPTGDITFDINGFSSVTNIYDNTIQIYPAIANNFIEIKSNDIIKNISIYNLQGQLILDEKTNNNNKIINVLNLKSGAYFVKIETSTQISNNKIIIVH